MLSLGSGGVGAEQTLDSGLLRAGGQAGGVFGAPPGFSQPRGIMTAGGGSRPVHRVDGLG